MIDEGDQVIADIQRIRQEIATRFNNDTAQLVEFYMQQQELRGSRLISSLEAIVLEKATLSLVPHQLVDPKHNY